VLLISTSLNNLISSFIVVQNINFDALAKLKEEIWAFFNEELDLKFALYKSVACFAHIISNRCISDQDVENKAGVSNRNAKKVLSYLYSRNFLRYDSDLCPQENKQLIYVNPSAISAPNLNLRWEEIFILSMLKMLPDFTISNFNKLTNLMNIKFSSPEKWIRNLLEKGIVQGEFISDSAFFHLNGYSYPVVFKHRFFSSYFPVIEGIVNLYGSKMELDALKRLLQLDVIDIFTLLAELSLVDYMGVSVHFNSGNSVLIRFISQGNGADTHRRLFHLDEDGIYYKILTEIILSRGITLSELAARFDMKHDEMERMILLLSSITGKESLRMWNIHQESIDEPVVVFKFPQHSVNSEYLPVNYESIALLMIILLNGNRGVNSEILFTYFPFSGRRLTKNLVKLSLSFRVNLIASTNGIKIGSMPNNAKEWLSGSFLINSRKGLKKLGERINRESTSFLLNWKTLIDSFNLSQEHSRVAISEETVIPGLELVLTEFDNVLLGIFKLMRTFNPETIAKLLFLDIKLIIMGFLSLYSRNFFKISIKKNNQIIITDLVQISSKSIILTRERLIILEKLFQTSIPLVISEEDILDKRFSFWDIGFFAYYDNIKGKYSPEKRIFTFSKIFLDPVLTTITCFKCGVSVSVLESFCDTCGFNIVRCRVCNRHIVYDDRVLVCSGCNSMFHVEHAREYLKQYDSCPVCYRKSPDLSPFV